MANVYILQCSNGEFYVGSATNLHLRLQEHVNPDTTLYRGAKFTKAHQPVKLVYTETYATEHEARIRERQLHRWSHAKKEALINGDFDRLRELSKSK